MEQKVVQEKKPITSEWIVVRDSKIHRMGVYAAKDIPKGTQIIEYVGKLITKKEADVIADEQYEKGESGKEGHVYIFELNDKFDIDGNVPWNTARLINHSCEPNCETEGDDEHIWIGAMRDIKEGEELSYDYCYDIEDYEDHPCKCGGKSCVGYIVGEKYRRKLGILRKRGRKL
ncbi:MAG: SET domain-containing protein-lysine N-methyltransferase [archaeon]